MMAITYRDIAASLLPPEDRALCSVGRWMTHDELPGWQEPCPDPGTECDWPPYVTCTRHAGELRRPAGRP